MTDVQTRPQNEEEVEEQTSECDFVDISAEAEIIDLDSSSDHEEAHLTEDTEDAAEDVLFPEDIPNVLHFTELSLPVTVTISSDEDSESEDEMQDETNSGDSKMASTTETTEKELTVTFDRGSDGEFLLVGRYKFKLPKSLPLRCNDSIACKGCDNRLPCADKRFSLDYYQHILSCHKFNSLGITNQCEDCKEIFVTTSSFNSHRSKHRRKPFWMTKYTYVRSMRVNKSETISCLGCKKNFKCSFGKTKNCPEPELSFYVHCIEECEAYKRLNLSKNCPLCSKIFLNRAAYAAHESQKHANQDEPVRSWMCSTLREDKRQNVEYNSIIACEGCGKTFPQQLGPSAEPTSIHRSYYVHCVEECEPFDKLGTIATCPKCQCKFLTNISCLAHFIKCMVHSKVDIRT